MSEERVGKNKAVYVTYSIVKSNGEVYEQSDVPIGYVHGGKSDLFEKIEDALEGKSIGERVEVVLAPEEGFGAHRPELTFTDDIDNVPPEFRRIGAEIEFENEGGGSMKFHVTRIEDGKLTIDSNHDLAGETITFVVDVAAIRPATPDEITNGMPRDDLPPLN